ncbi:MAG: cobyrinate a,c-diamide synthase [Chloroflexaceae bacterium]|nr:cobyrinate a,c-diamide synthase [Chloroflexaceae bacterium]
MATVPRLLLAAPMSGSGKTTVMAGLVAAFAARGLRVAPFKVGPDYIDPSYHTLAAGRACHNLDAWMLPSDLVPLLLARHTHDADLALIEGAMGLFDGYSGSDDTASSAHVARLTDTPVLLVLDVRAQARTAAALVQGLSDFDPRLRVAGVILNRVGSPKHARMVTAAIEQHVGLPVLGALHRNETLHLPERHLGLVPTAEPGRWRAWLEQARALVTEQIDLTRVFELARTAPSLLPSLFLIPGPPPPAHGSPSPVIAVAQDAAFSFRYQDNLDLLREAGAALAFFSPLADTALPCNTQALYLCGGFPELYAADLAGNTAMREQIRQAAAAGIPIYAECGGLMYLTETLLDGAGKAYPMVGVLPGRSRMTEHLTLGYRTIQASGTNWLLPAGETLRGHEFHYSTWERTPDIPPACTILPDEWHSEPRPDGALVSRVLASYVHLHFLACPELAARLVAAARGL